MKHHAVVKCNPPKSTHQASLRIIKKKNGKSFIGKYDSSKAKTAKNLMMTLFSTHRPPKAFDGPIKLEVVWCYPWRKAEPKNNRVNGFLYCDTRPDCDNLCKMLQDTLTALNYYRDDSQVAVLVFTKMWGDEPRIEVTISSLYV